MAVKYRSRTPGAKGRVIRTYAVNLSREQRQWWVRTALRRIPRVSLSVVIQELIDEKRANSSPERGKG